MERKDIRSGEEYAVRISGQTQEPFQRVRVLSHVREDRWRVEWVEPDAGMTGHLRSVQIIVPWKAHKAFLRDEECAERLYKARAAISPSSPLDDAVSEVFGATGEKLDVGGGAPEAIERVKARAHFDEPPAPESYVDRHGMLHLAFSEALALAQAFCRAEPQIVLDSIDAYEQEQRRTLRREGCESVADILKSFGPARALVRQWAGYDVAIKERDDRVERLRHLVLAAVNELRKAHRDREADSIERQLERI